MTNSNQDPADGASPRHPDADLLGHVLDGRFRLEEVIGRGGMGRVFRARQLSVERDVAVKVLHGSLSLEEELRQRFFREAKVVSGLNHPNIVQLYDFGRESEWGLLYLAMELIEGVGLKTLLERGRLAPRLALEIAHQVCGALAEAHAKDIIHRDLKADNILLVPVADGSLQVKVVDFGIALPQDSSERLTATGRIFGTPAYMAPEQARGGDVDARTDLFSLGVILFEMLTGKLPVDGDSHLEIMVEQIEAGPPPVASVLDDPGALPEPIARLTDRMLAVAPTERPGGAREVREAIESMVEELGYGAFRLPERPPGPERFEAWILEEASGPHPASPDPASPDSATPGSTREVDDPRRAASEEATVAEGGGPGANPETGSGDNAPPGGNGAANAPDASGGSGNNRSGLLWLSAAITVFLMVALAASLWAAYRWILPRIDKEDMSTVISESADAGINRQSGVRADASASSNGQDPVCGPIRRAEYVIDGKYRPQGESRAIYLEIRKNMVHVTWEAGADNVEGGGTLWLARTTSPRDGLLEVDCGRYAGTGLGNRCRGTVKKRGPLLVVDLEGAAACEDYFSGTWMNLALDP